MRLADVTPELSRPDLHLLESSEAGALSNSVAGQAQRMERGQMWQVAKGERVTLQAFGELAVVRIIYLLPGEK